MSQAPTSNTPFSNPTTQRDRAAVLREADRAINTRVAYGEVIDPQPSGRWKKPSPPLDPATLYPRLPPNSPWHSDPVPDEEPLGFSVEEMPVMGEPWEAERCAAILEVAAGPPPDSAEAGTSSPATTADLSPLLGSAVTAPPSTPSSASASSPSDVVSEGGALSKPWRRVG
jgi:hypothetical protein